MDSPLPRYPRIPCTTRPPGEGLRHVFRDSGERDVPLRRPGRVPAGTWRTTSAQRGKSAIAGEQQQREQGAAGRCRRPTGRRGRGRARRERVVADMQRHMRGRSATPLARGRIVASLLPVAPPRSPHPPPWGGARRHRATKHLLHRRRSQAISCPLRSRLHPRTRAPIATPATTDQAHRRPRRAGADKPRALRATVRAQRRRRQVAEQAFQARRPFVVEHDRATGPVRARARRTTAHEDRLVDPAAGVV